MAAMLIVRTLISKRQSAEAKNVSRPLLSDAELAAVNEIFYADHDANCWFVGIVSAKADAKNIAVESRQAAIALAREIAAGVKRTSQRTVEVKER